MERGHQRCTLATGGNIPASKVCNHVNSREFRQQGWVVQLQRVAGAEFLRAVAHRLPVGANRRNLASVCAGCGQQIRHNARIGMHQGIGGQRRTVQLVAPAGVEGQKLVR